LDDLRLKVFSELADMELWQLRTFAAVAKNLHFTRAAEDLNLSQPAVSQQIKSLETEIGESLFLREKDGICLTQAGKTMYEHANKILDIADELKLEVSENKDVLAGEIILGAVTRGLGNPFGRFYAKFKKKYHDIEIVFQAEQVFEAVAEKVRNGTIDIGLVNQEPDLDLSGLIVMPYGEFKLFFVAGENHPLARAKEVDVKDLEVLEWIVFEPGQRLRIKIDNYFIQVGITPSDIYSTNEGSLIKTMVEKNNKVSLLPEWGVYEELQTGKIVRLKVKGFDCKTQVNMIWKANRRTKTMSAVINYLLKDAMDGISLELGKT
jgi:LysR family transcriptional regulator, transcriptional activator of the cysJI operon